MARTQGKAPLIALAAGGTGGHLFPAEALAAALMARGERVALMTDARSAAFDSPAFANAERFVLRGSGLSGRGLLAAAAYALKNLILQGGALDGRGGIAFHREHMRYAALKYRLLHELGR